MSWNKLHRLPLVVTAASVLALTGCVQETLTHDAGIQNENAATLLEIGATAQELGDARAAIGFYQRAHAMDPGNHRVLLALGDALSDAGDHEGAILAYEQAIGAGADEASTLRGMGNALTALNRSELALPKLQRAVMKSPDAATYNSLGVTLDSLGEAEQAQEAYRQGLSLDPDHRNLANNLGLSLALSGQFHESIEILETLVMLPGSNTTHRQNLALAHGLAGDYDRAASVGREDLDELAVVRNISYYRVLRAMENHARKVTVVGIMRSNAQTPGAFPATGTQ
ncbi:MAG: tetratricopeptide repeat protein [Alphaproteobacteria bacterium]|nr:tetratricopeptide repeat protein [Alphaproteobacteria bacterium]MCZ6763699.1 tetratricopeptide repeat protein [Alphaproteobacteria bacterium]